MAALASSIDGSDGTVVIYHGRGETGKGNPGGRRSPGKVRQEEDGGL
jgi:hypothetical protein